MSIIRSISLVAAAALVLLPGTVKAQSGFNFGSGKEEQQAGPLFTAVAKSSSATYKKGESFYIAIQGDVQEPWHAYYRNPATFGEAMTASLEAPAGFKVEGPYFSAPHREVSMLGAAYTYLHPVVVWKVTPEADAPQSALFKASVSAQVCSETGCMPTETLTYNVEITEGEPAAMPDWDTLEGKVEVLGDAETTVSATSTDKEVTITFTSAEPVTKAYFFSDDNSTSPTAEQVLAKTGDNTYTLTIPRNDNSDDMQPVAEAAVEHIGKPLPQVTGILTFDGKHAKVPAPATTPAATDEDGDDEEEDTEEGDEEDGEEGSEEPAATAQAEEEDANLPEIQSDENVSVTGKSSTAAYKKGEVFHLALHVDIKEPWHAYFRNPATFGSPMTAKVKAPAGFKVEGPYFSAPRRHVSDMGVAYTHEKPVIVWKVTPEADAPGTAEFKLIAKAQICSTECLEEKAYTATVNLAEGEPAAAADWQGQDAKVEVLGNAETTVSATSTDKEVVITFTSAEPVEKAYFFSEDNSTDPVAEQVLAKTGDNTYTLTIPRNTNESGMQPLSDDAEALAGKPLPQVAGILTFGDKLTSVRADVSATTPAVVAPATPEPKAENTLPATPTATVAAKDAPAATETKVNEEKMGFWALAGSLFLGGLILNLMPCVFPVIGLKVMSFVELGGGSRSKVFAHSMVFALGILLSFWILSFLLVIVSNLDALAAAPWTDWFSIIINDSGSDARNWASWMQNPWVVYLILLLLLVLGLSMYGVFEIGVGATGVGQGLQQKKGLSGSFFQGFLVTVVATPCSGPFLGAAMPAVMALPGMLMVLGLTFMALGLASPYIVLGAFPSLVSALPRPGAWMESLKQGLSFLLFAAAAWMLYTYTAFLPEEQPIETLTLLWALVGVCCAFWVYGRWCPIYRTKSTRIIGLVVALVILGVSVFYSYPGRYEGLSTESDTEAQPAAVQTSTEATTAAYEVAKGAHPVWNTWSQSLMEQALADGHPVFVDFTAKWCMTCQSNKKLGYNEAVYAEMEKAGVVLMRADKTKKNAEIDAAMLALNRKSVPVNALYIPGKSPVVTKEVFTSDYLLDFLKQNLPAK